ncbi:MAG: NlpC/P60 family protein [Candidatus Omnitrophota bacterium]
MQQDKTAVQTNGKLREVRSVSVSADKTDLRDVEKRLVDTYLGIPYAHRGRTMTGLDCWGFLKLAYAGMGIRLFDVEDLQYSKVWGLKGKDYFKENYYHDWQQVSEPQIFDAVLFLNSCGVANHAGMILSNRRFIHCCRQGVIISRLDGREWREKVEGFYRLKAWL